VELWSWGTPKDLADLSVSSRCFGVRLHERGGHASRMRSTVHAVLEVPSGAYMNILRRDFRARTSASPTNPTSPDHSAAGSGISVCSLTAKAWNVLSAESPDWLLIAAECVGWGSQASSAIVSACVGIVSCPAATASWLSSSNRHCLTGLAAAELVITPRVTAARTQLGTERFELPDVFIFRPIRKTHSSLGRVSSVRAKGPASQCGIAYATAVPESPARWGYGLWSWGMAKLTWNVPACPTWAVWTGLIRQRGDGALPDSRHRCCPWPARVSSW